MPITLACPSCAKRFKARDESAGKKVKCPYCQVAVQVPKPEEAARSEAPPAPGPADSAPVPVPGPRPLPAPPAVASPDEWGALPTAPPPPAIPSFPPVQEPPEREPFPLLPPPPGRGGKDRPKPDKRDKGDRPEKSGQGGKGKEKESGEKPEQLAAPGWRSVRRGLFWVQFALFWLSLIGFIGFGKAVYTRAVGELPKGDGTSWVSIAGYINDENGPNAIRVSKTEFLNLALYGVPVFLASVCVVFGRLIAAGAPRHSGARSLFAFSAIFALFGFVALFGSFVFEKHLMKDEYRYTWTAFLVLVPLAEFWFLTALTASGMALKRPKAARAVGGLGFVFALTAFVAALGWDLYVDYGRPKKPDDDVKMYEQAALLLGWLLLVGMYWRAVRNVRVAAREYLDTVEET